MKNATREDRPRPRRIGISRSRSLCIDVLHFHRKVPTCAHDRMVDVSRVAEARGELAERIAWPILFIKAFALVAQRHPVLRQGYCRWPWPHLVEHPTSVAMMATHRDFQREAWLFWSRFRSPETRSLRELQSAVDEYLERPVEKVFRKQVQFSGLPTFLRRLIWNWNLNASSKRGDRAGTFFLTTIASRGAEIQHPPAFLTTNMTYGPIDSEGRCRVTFAYDHRLMDGLFIADRLAELEATLNGQILVELEELKSSESSPSNSSAA